MSKKDIIIILLCCILWGANIPITRWALNDIPPVFFASLRFIFIVIFLFPFLYPIPKQLFKIFLVAMSIGCVNFLFFYIGMLTTPSGLVSIVGQLGLPIAIFFSVWFLNEQISKKQLIAIALAFFGVLLAIYKPGNFEIDIGIIYIFISTTLGALGSIIMKKMYPIRGLQLQAWVGLFSFLPLLIYSIYFENIKIYNIIHSPPSVWIALSISVLFVSIIGHTTYYSMVKRYDISKVIPYVVTIPIWAILISNLFFGEKISIQFIIGSAICILGIGVLSFKKTDKV